MALGEIVVSLLARTGSFETDTGRAEKAIRKLKKEAKEAAATIGLAFTAVAAASIAMVKSSIDAMDEMSKLAQKTGTSVEALSALAYAGDLSDVSLQDLGSALVKLSKNMSDAAMGTGEAMKGFDALGISVKNADGSLKSSDVMVSEIAAKFSEFKDSAEKTALAVNLFGKSGAQLIPLLNSGAVGLAELRAEAEKLGVVLNTDTSKAAELFNDNLTRMNASVRGLANTLAETLLPALNKLYADFATFGEKAKLSSLAGDVISLDKALKQLEARKAFPLNWAAGSQIDAEIAKTTAALEKAKAAFNAADPLRQKVLSVDNYDLQGKPLTAAPAMKDTPKKGKDENADFKSYLDNLQKQIQKTEDLTTVEKLLDDIRRGSLTVSAEQQKQLEGLAKIVDSEKELVELRKLSREASIAEGDAVLKANEEYQSLMKRLLDGGPAAQLEEQRRQMLLLAEAMEQGRITAEQFNDAATGFLGLNKEIEKGKSLAEEFGLTFSSAFEDAIVSGKGFSDVLKGVFQDLLKIIVRMTVTEPLGKSFTGALKGAGGGGDLFGSIFSGIGSIFTGGIAGGSGFGTGSAFGNMDFGGFFANGGSPPVGKMSMVGEDGPEMFVPKTAGTIIPNGMLGGSKAITYSPTIYIDSRTDQAEVMKITERAVRAGNAQLLDRLETAGRI